MEPRAKLYINTGVVTTKGDIYNILRPLLKQTVTYNYYRGNRVESSGTGWVERIVVDHPEVSSYFTPLSICLNLDSSERVVIEFATTPRPDDDEELGGSRPVPRTAEELARDLRFIQMELMMSSGSSDPESADGPEEDEDA